jgi:hypothetical protein
MLPLGPTRPDDRLSLPPVCALREISLCLYKSGPTAFIQSQDTLEHTTVHYCNVKHLRIQCPVHKPNPNPQLEIEESVAKYTLSGSYKNCSEHS